MAVRAADTGVVIEDFDDDISDDGSSVHSYESECRFYTLRQKYKRAREETAGSQREIKRLRKEIYKLKKRLLDSQLSLARSTTATP